MFDEDCEYTLQGFREEHDYELGAAEDYGSEIGAQKLADELMPCVAQIRVGLKRLWQSDNITAKQKDLIERIAGVLAHMNETLEYPHQ